MRIYNLMKRKENDNGALYFCFLPTVNIISQNGKIFLYVAWLNICLVIDLK
jgi:hypothetical protein